MFQRIMRWGLPCFGAFEEIIRNSYPWSTSSSPPSQHEHGLMRAGVLDEEAQIMFMANSACCTMKCRLPRRTASYCSLMQWLKGRKDAGIWPLATVDVPRMHTGTYVRDEIKLLIKSLIRFIQHLHRHGQCTTGGTFGPNNIGVVGEDLKFTELKLSGFPEQLQEENYKSLSLVI
ncbi:hypothetical protein SAY87_018389 [Trapa incisa]|uniref:Uncharacterized protein n=1 Tax=Trapa incisa TaxID=236973 RepID=A0AAN7QTQ9_9MYRT|nr:hypothetical protein SAY87_018389 [Trapa incisa]